MRLSTCAGIFDSSSLTALVGAAGPAVVLILNPTPQDLNSGRGITCAIQTPAAQPKVEVQARGNPIKFLIGANLRCKLPYVTMQTEAPTGIVGPNSSDACSPATRERSHTEQCRYSAN